jgi:hypothetical protein
MPRHVPLEEQFAALAEENEWAHKSKQWREQRIRFLAEQSLRIFTAEFGYDKNSVEGWRKICKTIGVKNAKDLSSISECQKVRVLITITFHHQATNKNGYTGARAYSRQHR